MTADHYTEEEIEALIERFEAGELPKAEWTHAAHLVVAICYSLKHEREQAMNLVREFIIRHNESVGTLNTDSSGYHETITGFWMWLAASFLERNKNLNRAEACNVFIRSEYGGSRYPLNYYSEELLFSVRARKEWVLPDIKTLNDGVITHLANSDE